MDCMTYGMGSESIKIITTKAHLCDMDDMTDMCLVYTSINKKSYKLFNPLNNCTKIVATMLIIKYDYDFFTMSFSPWSWRLLL